MKISGGGGSDKQERGSETTESKRENERADIGERKIRDSCLCRKQHVRNKQSVRHAVVFRSSPTSTATRANDSAGQFVQVFQIMRT